jgi:phytoene dehydrogenase-like protein
MPDKYYDVIVIGRSLGALAAAALLARRDFTVLVIGQARRSASYQLDNKTLRRRAFSMLCASSPVWARVIGELAETQRWKRRVNALDPMLQVVMPGRRFDIPPDAALFDSEVEREFPKARRLVADLYQNFARVTAAADTAFEKDAIWPPGKWMERRQTGRIASTLPYARAEPHADLLAEFPRRHPYRRIVTESARFATDLAVGPPAFAIARLHGAWTRGVDSLVGGEQELEELMLERIRSNGGVHEMGERAASIEVRRGSISGVHIDGDMRPMGAGFVISDANGEEIAALSGGEGISKKAQREWPRIIPTTGRFVVSLLVRREGVPEPLGGETLVFPSDTSRLRSTIHLQRCTADDPEETLLVAEVLRAERDPVRMSELRALVVQRLCEELPFLERHLLIVDSVHDGLPVWFYTSNGDRVVSPVEVDRSQLANADPGSEPMERQIEVDPPGYLGLAGEPLRGPIGRTLLVGSSVLPGLGQEGRLLAACGAVRLVTQSDKRKARMRREMWTKLEIS